MIHIKALNILLFISILFLFQGCVDSSSSTSPQKDVSIKGAVQKGPFIVGTPVYVNKLDESGNASESTTITEIEDSIGSFTFKVSENSPVQIISNGYYFSELTGQISSGTLTLKAIYNASSENEQIAYVNILTHLINDRILELIKSGTTELDDAISQAQTELVSALNEVLPVESTPNFSALSVYNTNADNHLGNAYLLALSTAFYKYAEIKAFGLDSSADAQLALILNQIAKDFATDGLIQQEGFIDGLTSALRKLNPQAISENLRNRSRIDFSEPLEIPDIKMFFGLCAGSSECKWSAAAAMPAPTRGHSSAEYQGKIYIFGGTTPNDYANEYDFEPIETAYTGVYAYDPEINEWSQKQSMPTGLYVSGAHTVGDKIYVFGGYGNGGFINTVMEFDPVNNNWELKSAMPTYRYIFMSEQVNGKIYVIGGQGTIDDGPWESGKSWEYKSHVEIYDPANDIWSEGTAAPSALASGASCSFDGKIYIFGGSTGSHSAKTFQYNTNSNSWAEKSSAPTARNGHACVSIGSDFYVIGGRNHNISNPEQLDIIEHYSAETDSWKNAGFLPTARYWTTVNLVNERIYIMGGLGGEKSELLSAVEVMDTSIQEN